MLVHVGVEVLLGPELTLQLVHHELLVSLLLTRSGNDLTHLIITSVSSALLNIEFSTPLHNQAQMEILYVFSIGDHYNWILTINPEML